ALAGVALILACLGVFGLLSYAITLRQKEIGIRLALGAPRSTIVSLIASQLFWPALAGGVFGISFGALATSLIEEQSRFLGHADGVVLGSVVLVFLLSACLASLVPVMRATRIDV